MAKVITFGISKGGCSKTLTSGVIAKMLTDQGKRVLVVDMDSQANSTALLSREFDVCTVFEEKTVLEALINLDAEPYIYPINERLDLLPSNDFLISLPRKLAWNEISYYDLQEILEPLQSRYDYILIDTPPAIGEQTQMALVASTHAVIMFDGSLFSYYAIPRFMDVVQGVREKLHNDALQIAGIAAVVEWNASEVKPLLRNIEQSFPGLLFERVNRKAAVRRLPKDGFEHNPEWAIAQEVYQPFFKELMHRVGTTEWER